MSAQRIKEENNHTGCPERNEMERMSRARWCPERKSSGRAGREPGCGCGCVRVDAWVCAGGGEWRSRWHGETVPSGQEQMLPAGLQNQI